MITTLEDFKTYNMALDVAEVIRSIVEKWKYFEKDTVGKQFVRAVDSIASNLSEGLGKYHYRESKNFAYYSRGSLFETKTWLVKSFNRELITKDQFDELMTKLDVIGKMINGYINSLGDVNDPMGVYLVKTDVPEVDHGIPNA